MTDLADSTPAPPARSRKPSSKLLALGAIVLAAALALLTSVQRWLDIKFFTGVASAESLSVSGQELSPALTLLALAALASALVLTIAGPIFRRVIGVLVAVLGGGLAAIGLLTVTQPLAGARAAIEAVTGITGDDQFGLVRATVVSAWPTVAGLSGIVLVFAGLWIVIFGGRWFSGGRKYQPAEAGGRASSRGAAGSDRISDWDALSDGDDPTELDR